MSIDDEIDLTLDGFFCAEENPLLYMNMQHRNAHFKKTNCVAEKYIPYYKKPNTVNTPLTMLEAIEGATEITTDEELYDSNQEKINLTEHHFDLYRLVFKEFPAGDHPNDPYFFYHFNAGLKCDCCGIDLHFLNKSLKCHCLCSVCDEETQMPLDERYDENSAYGKCF